MVLGDPCERVETPKGVETYSLRPTALVGTSDPVGDREDGARGVWGTEPVTEA